MSEYRCSKCPARALVTDGHGHPYQCTCGGVYRLLVSGGRSVNP